MGHGIENSVEVQVQSELEILGEATGLPFSTLLPRTSIQAALTKCGVAVRKSPFNSVVTLWAFLGQVLNSDDSCEAAVARVNAQRIKDNLKPCSESTASYCNARARLPEEVISSLACEVGYELHDQAQEELKWKGHDVVIVDGSTATMADTQKNQEEYPQSRNQRPGLGFPILRFVVLISLAVGSVLECAVGRCRGKKTGEQSLFRQLRDTIKPGTVVLGDRLFDSYHDIAYLSTRGVFVLFGMRQSRKKDFRKGQRIGHDDHIMTWEKPRFHKDRFDSREEWATMPDTMNMRELRLILKRQGFKTRVIIVVTNLLDAEKYPKQDLMQLFSTRWHCELDLRSIKCTLKMGHLKCKTPSMVRKELWMHLLAYSVIRRKMVEAAKCHHQVPRKLSFASGRRFISEIYQMIQQEPQGSKMILRLEEYLFECIAKSKVGDRPGRKEPRAVKKQELKFPKLTKPRVEARKGLPA